MFSFEKGNLTNWSPAYRCSWTTYDQDTPTKVRDFDCLTGGVDQDVFELQVPVKHISFLEIQQPQSDLLEEPHSLSLRESLLLFQEVKEGVAIDELHDEVNAEIIIEVAVEFDNVEGTAHPNLPLDYSAE